MTKATTSLELRSKSVSLAEIEKKMKRPGDPGSYSIGTQRKPAVEDLAKETSYRRVFPKTANAALNRLLSEMAKIDLPGFLACRDEVTGELALVIAICGDTAGEGPLNLAPSTLKPFVDADVTLEIVCYAGVE